MISEHSKTVAEQAKAIYADRLQVELEPQHWGQFVAIEPTWGDYFVAGSFGQAVSEARTAHPDRIAFVIHIGHKAAIHIGGMTN